MGIVVVHIHTIRAGPCVNVVSRCIYICHCSIEFIVIAHISKYHFYVVVVVLSLLSRRTVYIIVFNNIMAMCLKVAVAIFSRDKLYEL